MSTAIVFSAQARSLRAEIIDVEIDITRGLHAFALVGLGNRSVDEARDRISAAIKNTGFISPKKKNQKVVVSLAPADTIKEGTGFDLAIAIGYLLAAKEICFDPAGKLFIGELSLRGEVRSMKSVLTLCKKAREVGFKEIFVPRANVREAALIDGIVVYGAGDLKEVIRHLNKRPFDQNLSATLLHRKLTPQQPTHNETVGKDVAAHIEIDFADIKGQRSAKRALEIAAAGQHHIALSGPPGTGKTLLAKAFANILPSLDVDSSLEATAIHSMVELIPPEKCPMRHPPFRAPHHTASYSAIIGGGANIKPGEITLAHKGVLFLDEFPEFDRRITEALRQPLEERSILLHRTRGSERFPADFLLLVAMNPCPCGYFGFDHLKKCRCSQGEIDRYRKKLSGPIIDRIDLWTEVAEPRKEVAPSQQESTVQIRKRVESARLRQRERFDCETARNFNISCNAHINVALLESFVKATPEAINAIEISADKMHLSERSRQRILKIARTIADLSDSDTVEKQHVLEALQYRKKET